MFIPNLRSVNMLKKIYCLFKAEPEEISGFADFVKELEKSGILLEVILLERLAGASEQVAFLNRVRERKDAVLVTDTELRCELLTELCAACGNSGDVIPVAGFLCQGNGNSLSYKYVFESFEGITADYFAMVYCRIYGLPLDILETKRLKVREMILGDIDRLYEIYAEPSITEYMEGLYPDRQEEIEFSKSYIENMYGFYGYGLWMVIEKSSDRIIGRAGLSNREVDGEVCLELGYVIAKESQRQGYATEVSQAILEYAKDELGAIKVIALMKPENEASVRTARKLGFKEVCEVTLGEESYLEYCIDL